MRDTNKSSEYQQYDVTEQRKVQIIVRLDGIVDILEADSIYTTVI